MALHGRDLVVLILAAIIIIITIQLRGDLYLQVSWYEDFKGPSTYRNGHAPDASEKVPFPVITDLEGDGENELIIATRDPKLRILRMKTAKENEVMSSDVYTYNEDGTGLELVNQEDSPLIVVAETSLLSSTIIKTGRQPVALHTGYLEPYNQDQNRQQVIIVVTEGWRVLCYDHKLNLKWEKQIDADLAHSYLSEVSIAVISTPLQKGDTGAVIVGARLESRKDLSSFGLHGQRKQNTDDLGDVPKTQPSKSDGDDEEEGSPDDQLAPEQETLTSEGHNHFGASSHFSFYAFEGLTGANRWKHEADDFYEETAASDILRPQHEVHTGEMDWRNFRHSIVHALPHVWTTPAHSHFEIAHFERRRSGRDRQGQQRRDLHHSTEWVNTLFGGRRPHAQSEHVAHPNSLVAHLRDGIEVIHLYTGRPITRLSLKPGAIHVDINADAVIDHAEAVGGVHGSTAQNAPHGVTIPNCYVLFATGVPPSDTLFNGTICAHSLNFLRIQNFQESAVLDELEKETKVATPAVMREPHDSLLVSTAKGANTQAGAYWRYQTVFFANNGLVTSFRSDGKSAFQTATQSVWGAQSLKGDGEGRRRRGWRRGRLRRVEKKKRRRGNSTSTNETELEPEEVHDVEKSKSKRKNKRAGRGKSTKAPKIEDPFLTLRRSALFPSLTAFSLRADPDNREDHVAVVGEEILSILSQEGHLRGELTLPNLPIAPPIVGDFNNDGINDIIVITPEGFCGIVAVEGVGNYLFLALTSILLIVLLAALASKSRTIFNSSLFSSSDDIPSFDDNRKDDGLRVRTFGHSTNTNNLHDTTTTTTTTTSSSSSNTSYQPDPTRIPRRHIISSNT